MKLLLILFSLALLCTSNAAAQTFEKIEDSLKLEAFDEYVRSVTEHELDSLTPGNVSGSYRIIYRSGCPYTETIMVGDSGFYDIISGTGGKRMVIELNTGRHKTSNPFTMHDLPNEDFTVCLENVEANLDSTAYHVSVPQAYVDQSMGERNFLPVLIGDLGSFEAISFNGGEYLFVSSSGISYVGSQTSHGKTITYFLERE